MCVSTDTNRDLFHCFNLTDTTSKLEEEMMGKYNIVNYTYIRIKDLRRKRRNEVVHATRSVPITKKKLFRAVGFGYNFSSFIKYIMPILVKPLFIFVRLNFCMLNIIFMSSFILLFLQQIHSLLVLTKISKILIPNIFHFAR